MDIQSSGPKLPPPPVADEEGSEGSIGTAADKASQDRHRPTSYGHYPKFINQLENKVAPTAVVNEKYRPLFKAALRGQWKDVEHIMNGDSKAMTAEIMRVKDESVTLLEVAVIAAQDQLVENLVKLLPRNCDDLIFRRALCNAARGGRLRMVKVLVKKIDADYESIALALSTAISWAPTQKEVIWYLVKHTSSLDDDTMSSLIMAGHLDIVFYLNLQRGGSETTKELDRSLRYLAPMMSYFRSRARLSFWEKSIYNCIPKCLVYMSFGNSKAMKMARAPFVRRIVESKMRHEWLIAYGNLALIKKMTTMETPKILEFLLTSDIVLDAASLGISEFVKLCLEYFPELMWEKNFTKELIKEVVKGRHVELFRLVNAHSTTPYLNDDERCDLIEAVVEWSPGCVSADASGAAFLTQRELQWFKVVEDMSDPSLKSLKFKVLKVEDRSDPSFKSMKLEETKKRRGKTYWEVFVEQRQDLLKEAGQWMKDTSSSCSFVATLIITVAFAAAFTVPGGNHNKTGRPIFLHKDSFIIFAIADALALFSSATATLMFLAILTSRYEIESFLHSLPSKMILGLTFLFLSLAFMLVAFGSALTIVLSERLPWIYIPITLLAAFPVILSVILRFPLYVEMVESTYWPPLYRPMKIWK